MPDRCFAAPERVLMRAVTATFDRCVREGDASIDVEQARAQQESYARLLRGLNINVEQAKSGAGDDHPDACFVEDTAVLLNSHALLTRPGHPARRGEPAVMRPLIEQTHAVTTIDDPRGTLDGGDVLRFGPTLFVGRSGRTNDAGIAALQRVAERDGMEVVAVEVRGGLHLKSGVTMLDSRRAVYHAALLDPAPLAEQGVECISVPEPAGANLLGFGEDVVLSAAAPRTAELVADLGFRPHLADVDELHKADGALTCLSLRVPPTGCWCV